MNANLNKVVLAPTNTQMTDLPSKQTMEQTQ